MSVYRFSALAFGAVAVVVAAVNWFHKPSQARLTAAGRIELQFVDAAGAEVVFDALDDAQRDVVKGFSDSKLAQRTLQVLGDLALDNANGNPVTSLEAQNFWIQQAEPPTEAVSQLASALSAKHIAGTNLIEVSLSAKRKADVQDVLLTYTQLFLNDYNNLRTARLEREQELNLSIAETQEKVTLLKQEIAIQKQEKGRAREAKIAQLKKKIAAVEASHAKAVSQFDKQAQQQRLQMELQTEVSTLKQQLKHMEPGSAMALLAEEEIRITNRKLTSLNAQLIKAPQVSVPEAAPVEDLQTELAQLEARQADPAGPADNEESAINDQLKTLLRMLAMHTQELNQLQLSNEGLFVLAWQQKPYLVIEYAKPRT